MKMATTRAILALLTAALIGAPTGGVALLGAAAPQAPLAPGPLPNDTLPGGNITLPNGTLPNGSLPGGNITLPNGTLPNGTLPNGSLPGPVVPEFVDATVSAGLSHAPFSRIAWGDYDGDGYDDIMFSGGVLYRNNRGGGFDDVSLFSGTRGAFSGGVWGDYNNDGRLDYYATAWAPTWDTLFRNNGDGTFTNVTAVAGMPKDDLPSEAAAWADYDRDGCLDLYVANYEWPPPDDETGVSYGTPNILWHNECDGTFTNATIAAGMYENLRSRGVVWGDFNNDHWPDLYVSNYRLEPNELWVNSGNGTFTNRAEELGVDCENVSVLPNPSGACGHSIGSDFADFDGDGDLDLFVANLAHPQFLALGHDTSQVYRNRGAPSYGFVEMREASGVRYCETASNPTFGDFNADGNSDLFVTSIYENRTNNLYVADRPGHFDDATQRAGVESENGWGAGWSDYDRDGDLDLLVGSSSGARLYRNGGNGGWFVELELVGRNSNKAAIGATVTVTPVASNSTRTSLQFQEIQGGDGTGSQSSMRLFFGNPEQTATVRATIRWPSGLIQNLTLDTRQIHRIEEPEGYIDVSVTGLSATPASPVAGAQVILTAAIENIGTAPATRGTLAFYRDSASPSNELARKSFGLINGTLNLSAVTTAPASPGAFNVLARLEDVEPDDQNAGNDARSVSLTVRSANLAPVANLTASPLAVEVGGSVHFGASGSSDDSAISQYIFDFGDGESALENLSAADHTYPAAGAFTARLTVIDDNGVPSTNDASVAISVRPPGAQPPTAVIDSISPASPEMQGAAVTFEGHGVSTDTTIAQFEWTSDRDGALSSQPSFQTSSLSLGQHVISLRVQDSNGFWSEPATATFRVVSTGSVQIVFLNIVDGFSIRGPTTVNGTNTLPSGVTARKVEWRIDQGNLILAQGTTPWSFVLDPAQYDLGSHNLTVVVTDSDGLRTTRTLRVVLAGADTVPPGGSFLLVAAATGLVGIGALIALAAATRGNRRRAAAARPDLRRLPVVPPPPPIRPLPVPSRPVSPAPPRRRVKAVSLATKPASVGAPPGARPPANP